MFRRVKQTMTVDINLQWRECFENLNPTDDPSAAEAEDGEFRVKVAKRLHGDMAVQHCMEGW